MYLCQYFIDVLALMYVFPYFYSALMALHTVLHVDTVLVAVALMIMTSLGPSPGLGRHTRQPPGAPPPRRTATENRGQRRTNVVLRSFELNFEAFHRAF